MCCKLHGCDKQSLCIAGARCYILQVSWSEIENKNHMRIRFILMTRTVVPEKPDCGLSLVLIYKMPERWSNRVKYIWKFLQPYLYIVHNSGSRASIF